jgi:hypothetical protein
MEEENNEGMREGKKEGQELEARRGAGKGRRRRKNG